MDIKNFKGIWICTKYGYAIMKNPFSFNSAVQSSIESGIYSAWDDFGKELAKPENRPHTDLIGEYSSDEVKIVWQQKGKSILDWIDCDDLSIEDIGMLNANHIETRQTLILKIKKINCLICEKEIKELYFTENDYTPLESRMWNDGIVDAFSCGYGSKFDTDTYRFGICDNCLELKIKSGTIAKLSKEELKIRRDFFRMHRKN